MNKKGRYFVGGLGVDSGTIFVGDPCYITGNKALCNDKLYEIMKDKTTPFMLKSDFKKNRFGDFTDVGIITDTNYGDGHYPCYITYDAKGSPTKLEVIFTRNVSETDYVKALNA